MIFQDLKHNIQNFLETKYKGSTRFMKPKLFIDNFGELSYKEILQATLFLDSNTTPFSRRVYCFINDITSIPLCRICNSPVVFNANNGYPIYCSNSCRFKDMDTIQDVKRKTNIIKYGTGNVLSSEYGKDKIRNTNIQKYGVDNYTKTEEYKNRIKSGDIKRNSNGAALSKTSLDKHYNSLNEKYPDLIPLFTREEYKGAGSYDILYNWECKHCSKHFQRWLNNNYPLYCPYCSPKGTKSEIKMKRFLESLGVSYEYRTRKILTTGQEIDFYIPDKSIGIEINGLYWHSEKCIPDKNYHIKKTKNAESQGIQLLQIFEDELISKEQIVFSRIKHILGKVNRRIYARKCIVKEIDNKTKSKFLNKYHIQGNVNTPINLGLFYKDRMVAIMTFSNLRIVLGSNNTKDVYELIRYCSVNNFSIVGGAGKLLSHFKTHYNPISITSYADRRWSQGNLYKQLGFTLAHVTTPNYYYTKTYLERLYRFGFRKSIQEKKLEIYNPELSENKNMIANGYTRIWDCGNYKFVMCTKSKGHLLQCPLP